MTGSENDDIEQEVYIRTWKNINKYKENVYLFEIPKKVKEASLKDLYKNDKKRIEFIKYVGKFLDDFSNNKVLY